MIYCALISSEDHKIMIKHLVKLWFVIRIYIKYDITDNLDPIIVSMHKMRDDGVGFRGEKEATLFLSLATC